MNLKYTPEAIEKKWQARWEENKTFAAEEIPGNPKYYLLEMFPYPSGRIHMGHVRNYTIGDVVARYKRMKGFNVLHPMGWDAFGMPAENAAIAHGTHPALWTHDNIAFMKQQLKRMGFSYDWSREMATCEPGYYRWEQLFFLWMYEKGLAYKKSSLVNWCPTCQTVLANEQVESGACWRCSTEVTQRELEQWFFRITAYVDELLDYCDRLPGWPERVMTMQKNWIGKSHGCEVSFPLADRDGAVTVFTTRLDTLYGATFMLVAAEHPLVMDLVRGTEQEGDIQAWVDKIKKQDKVLRTSDTYDKEGMFLNAYCTNPVTKRKMPIYAANFVLADYGTGCVMAVPTHDQRDFEFAQKYNLPLIVVIQPHNKALNTTTMTEAYVENGVLVNSGPFNGMENEKALEKIADHIESLGLGKRTIQYRLRDWGISRQRYWGAPIPILYCDTCGVVPVPEADLPVVLPRDVELTGEGGSPLARHEAFSRTACPRCGGPARRETDTMDTFVESSWYFEKFCCRAYDASPGLDRNAVNYWMPVDQYIGGIEHAILHLLYARFFTKMLRDFGVHNVDEPFTNLLTQGMVCKETMRCPTHGYLFPSEVHEGRCSRCQAPVVVGKTEKMSKSLKNIVDPDYLVLRYGADTARMFCLFAAPPEKDLEWSDQGVEGSFRFLGRIWRITLDYLDDIRTVAPFHGEDVLEGDIKALRRKTHQTIKKVSRDLEDRFRFNTAISAVMELVNALYATPRPASTDRIGLAVVRETVEAVLKLLAPIVPHMTEELWEILGGKAPLTDTAWPAYDTAVATEEEMTLVVQVNGKVRSRLTVAADEDEATLLAMARSDEKIQKFIEAKTVLKEIYVPGKLVNIVIKD